MPTVSELVRTGFDGTPATLDDVIDAGLDDPAHRTRVGPLAAALGDPATGPTDRWLATVVLASWAEPAGHAAVRDAARVGAAAPWYGLNPHRLYPADESFGLLAGCLAVGADPARAKGTDTDRVDTVTALLELADQEFFDTGLRSLLDPPLTVRVLPTLRRVAYRGAGRLLDGVRLPFDLFAQLAGLAVAVVRVDDEAGSALATTLIAAADDATDLTPLVGTISAGRGPDSARLSETLADRGTAGLRDAVARAVARRHRRAQPE